MTTCNPLPPVVLQKDSRPNLLQAIAYFQRGRDDGSEFHLGRRIEVEHQSTGNFRIALGAVPGVQLERADLRDGDERLDAVDLHIGRLVALHLDEGEQIRNAGHRVALKELLAVDSVRSAHQRTWPAPQMRQQPVADSFVVPGEVELRGGTARSCLRPHHLVRAGERHSHHDVRPRLFGGRAHHRGGWLLGLRCRLRRRSFVDDFARQACRVANP